MARRENVFNLATFDFTKHYTSIYNKLQKLLRDFNIEKYIYFKNDTGLNNCTECHVQISEPTTHEQAKKKLFNLFVYEKDYLVESELKANKNLFVPGKGIRNYQFDVFVIHVKKFLEFQKILADHIFNGTELDIKHLTELEQGMLFAVEADGGGHSEEKDAVRDRFFFNNYNIVTVRYGVSQLIPMEETNKMKKLRIKYSIYKDFAFQPEFANITSEQIVAEARNLYRAKYYHIK